MLTFNNIRALGFALAASFAVFFVMPPNGGLDLPEFHEVSESDENNQYTVNFPASWDVGTLSGWNGSYYANRVESTSGFTEVVVHPGALEIYISDTDGSDSNDGLSPAFPKKTINAGLLLTRSGFPDIAYLKAGDTFRGGIGSISSGESPTKIAVLSTYGTSDKRPVVEDRDPLDTFNASVNYVMIQSIDFYNYRNDPSHPEYSPTSSSWGNMKIFGSTGLKLEDNRFRFMELVISVTGGRPSQDIVIHRNMWNGVWTDTSSLNRDNRPSNIFSSSTDGLTITENVFDSGGWNRTVVNAAANQFNHNLYLQDSNIGNNILVSKNIITRASSHGVHGRPGGMYSDNFISRNTVNLQLGYDGSPLAPGTFATASNNVIAEGHSMVKGNLPAALPAPADELLTSAYWGIIRAEPGGGTFTVDGNIVHSRAPNDTDWMAYYGGLSRVSIGGATAGTETNNIERHWETPTQGDGPVYPDPDRTLGDYYNTLTVANLVSSGFIDSAPTGTDDFDTFMLISLQRNRMQWDETITADGINDYVRAGYGL
jgi:hypothetical protein